MTQREIVKGYAEQIEDLTAERDLLLATLLKSQELTREAQDRCNRAQELAFWFKDRFNV